MITNPSSSLELRTICKIWLNDSLMEIWLTSSPASKIKWNILKFHKFSISRHELCSQLHLTQYQINTTMHAFYNVVVVVFNLNKVIFRSGVIDKKSL